GSRALQGTRSVAPPRCTVRQKVYWITEWMATLQVCPGSILSGVAGTGLDRGGIPPTVARRDRSFDRRRGTMLSHTVGARGSDSERNSHFRIAFQLTVPTRGGAHRGPSLLRKGARRDYHKSVLHPLTRPTLQGGTPHHATCSSWRNRRGSQPRDWRHPCFRCGNLDRPRRTGFDALLYGHAPDVGHRAHPGKRNHERPGRGGPHRGSSLVLRPRSDFEVELRGRKRADPWTDPGGARVRRRIRSSQRRNRRGGGSEGFRDPVLHRRDRAGIHE